MISLVNLRSSLCLNEDEEYEQGELDRLASAYDTVSILYEEQREKLRVNDELLKALKQQIKEVENTDE